MNANKLIAVAAVAASASMPMAATAETYTDNKGVVWTYVSNGDGENTVTLGTGTACIPTDASVDAAEIPWRFERDGISYTVTQLGNLAFFDCSKLTGTLNVPSSVTKFGSYTFKGTGLTGISSLGAGVKSVGGQGAFWQCASLAGTIVVNDNFTANLGNFAFADCTSMKGIVVGSGTPETGRYFAKGNTSLVGAWFKGRPAVSSGQQNYTTVRISGTFKSCTALKLVLFGKNTEPADLDTVFDTTTGCKVFVPSNGKWGGLTNLGGAGNVMIPYGAGEDLDLAVDEQSGVLLATPTTGERLVQVLEVAPLFKTHFRLEAHISVTNTLDFTGVTITEDTLKNVTFDRLMFSAKTQAQLNAILSALPPTTPVSIDPTGLTENMVIPETYTNVYVKTVPGVRIRRTTKGFMIIVK